MTAIHESFDGPAPPGAGTASELAVLEESIGRRWNLGRNSIVAWRALGRGIEILVAPSHHLLAHADDHRRMTSGARQMGPRSFAAVAGILGVVPEYIPIAADVGDTPGQIAPREIERLIRRYAISRTLNRAVALFDIVGFSLLTPVEQVAQLNSLEVSINVALRCMEQAGMSLDLGRSTTGDGYYVWNHDKGPDADVQLTFLMMLVLADNAISRGVAGPGLVPELRTCFTVGGHYSYFQVEGLHRGAGEYIVGDATIELARLAAETLPGQILVGDFERPLDTEGEALDSLAFMGAVQRRLDGFAGAELDAGRISGIRCYFTGEPQGDGRFLVNKYDVVDKHGIHHTAFNAKMNIYRDDGEPLFLGARNQDLKNFAARQSYIPVGTLPAPWD